MHSQDAQFVFWVTQMGRRGKSERQEGWRQEFSFRSMLGGKAAIKGLGLKRKAR